MENYCSQNKIKGDSFNIFEEAYDLFLRLQRIQI